MQTATQPKKQKRVRLRPETREQLLNRLLNPELSLYETSILLQCSRATVRRLADNKELDCVRTKGGQRRFPLRAVARTARMRKIKGL